MSIAPEGSHESLKFRMLGSEDDLDNWGHEYVRFVFSFFNKIGNRMRGLKNYKKKSFNRNHC